MTEMTVLHSTSLWKSSSRTGTLTDKKVETYNQLDLIILNYNYIASSD